MFIFSKGTPLKHNIISDRKNKWAGQQVHGTERQSNGKTKERSVVQKSKKVKEFGFRYNIWDIPADKNNKTGHPAVFCEQIANDHIISWSNEGDVVFDPFAGSGTTAKMAMKNKRNYIGFEISVDYYDMANKRLEEYKNQLSMFNGMQVKL